MNLPDKIRLTGICGIKGPICSLDVTLDVKKDLLILTLENKNNGMQTDLVIDPEQMLKNATWSGVPDARPK